MTSVKRFTHLASSYETRFGYKKALKQEKELTSHAGIVWFATSVIGLGRQSAATVVLFKCE